MKRAGVYNYRFVLMLIVLVLTVASNIRAGETATVSDGVPYSAISWFLSVILLASFGWWAKDIKRGQDRTEFLVGQLIAFHNIKFPDQKIDPRGEK